MTVLYETLKLWQRAARLAGSILLMSTPWAVVASAQVPEPDLPLASTAPPYALFQYSTLTGSGNTITATWLPVVTTSGTVYKNVKLQFNVDTSGNLTIASGYPQVGPAPATVISNFRAGDYVGPSAVLSGGMKITVNGPGIAPGGATEWSLSAASGANGCTYPSSATWYVGPLSSSPIAARLKAVGITNTEYSYGIGGSQCTINGGAWNPDSILGFSQAGSSITIVSFTKSAVDKATPVDQISYTLSK